MPEPLKVDFSDLRKVLEEMGLIKRDRHADPLEHEAPYRGRTAKPMRVPWEDPETERAYQNIIKHCEDKAESEGITINNATIQDRVHGHWGDLSKENRKLVTAYLAVGNANLETFIKKQLDYGPGNIAQSYNAFGVESVIIRMNDKMQRLIHLTGKGGEPANESMRDSFLDLANYAIIAILCMDGNWPGVVNE